MVKMVQVLQALMQQYSIRKPFQKNKVLICEMRTQKNKITVLYSFLSKAAALACNLCSEQSSVGQSQSKISDQVPTSDQCRVSERSIGSLQSLRAELATVTCIESVWLHKARV